MSAESTVTAPTTRRSAVTFPTVAAAGGVCTSCTPAVVYRYCTLSCSVRLVLLVSATDEQQLPSSWNERPQTLPCPHLSNAPRGSHISVERCRETPAIELGHRCCPSAWWRCGHGHPASPASLCLRCLSSPRMCRRRARPLNTEPKRRKCVQASPWWQISPVLSAIPRISECDGTTAYQLPCCGRRAKSLRLGR